MIKFFSTSTKHGYSDELGIDFNEVQFQDNELLYNLINSAHPVENIFVILALLNARNMAVTITQFSESSLAKYKGAFASNLRGLRVLSDISEK